VSTMGNMNSSASNSSTSAISMRSEGSPCAISPGDQIQPAIDLAHASATASRPARCVLLRGVHKVGVS
jgi:hypothetical protein